MSIESDAHLSYLVHWAFLMVARILFFSLIGSLVVVAVFAAGGDTAAGIVVGGASWPVWVILTIYLSAAPRVTSNSAVMDEVKRSKGRTKV